jgi:hypothetical protein
LPTFFETVNPTRAGPSSARAPVCNTKAATGARGPVATPRKSARFRNFSTGAANLPAAQALRRFRPRVRRALSTLRPPLVAMRLRKPWRRLRTNLLGW